MENEIYRHTITEATDARDRETPTLLIVTREANGFLVWIAGLNGYGILGWYFLWDRDKAIEFAVSLNDRSEDDLYKLAKIGR